MFFGGMWILWVLIFVGSALFINETFLKKEAGEIKVQNDAVEILKRSYVRGDIDREVFEQIRNDLR
jgi:uncharacterized membrane protein